MVPLPDEQPRPANRTLRGDQEAIRAHTKVPSHRKELGTLQGGSCGGGQQEHGCCAQILCRREAIGLCGIFDAGHDHLRRF